MLRTVIGACIGTAVIMTAILAFGAYSGFTQGVDWKQPHLRPGFEAAMDEAGTAAVYLWWIAFLLGPIIGGLAGFGSWLVRPRNRAIAR